MSDINNAFFTQQIFESEIHLEVNADVLKRIYGDGIDSEARMPIEFFFTSDLEAKLKKLGLALLAEFPDYNELRLKPYQNIFELIGTSNPIQMDLATINDWNQKMWNLGYRFDCKLDGWQVGT